MVEACGIRPRMMWGANQCLSLCLTAIGALAAGLKNRQTRLNEARRCNEEVLARLSHELRTPLNALSGWLQLLKSGKLSADETAHAIQSMERNIQRETKLVDDLLKASSLVCGTVADSGSRIDLRGRLTAPLFSSQSG